MSQFSLGVHQAYPVEKIFEELRICLGRLKGRGGQIIVAGMVLGISQILWAAGCCYIFSVVAGSVLVGSVFWFFWIFSIVVVVIFVLS